MDWAPLTQSKPHSFGQHDLLFVTPIHYMPDDFKLELNSMVTRKPAVYSELV